MVSKTESPSHCIFRMNFSTKNLQTRGTPGENVCHKQRLIFSTPLPIAIRPRPNGFPTIHCWLDNYYYIYLVYPGGQRIRLDHLKHWQLTCGEVERCPGGEFLVFLGGFLMGSVTMTEHLLLRWEIPATDAINLLESCSFPDPWSLHSCNHLHAGADNKFAWNRKSCRKPWMKGIRNILFQYFRASTAPRSRPVNPFHQDSWIDNLNSHKIKRQKV